MSARQLPEVWEVLFAYKGKTMKHWRSIMTIIDCTGREAEREATSAYAQDMAAVDMQVVPVEEGQL